MDVQNFVYIMILFFRKIEKTIKTGITVIAAPAIIGPYRIPYREPNTANPSSTTILFVEFVIKSGQRKKVQILRNIKIPNAQKADLDKGKII